MIESKVPDAIREYFSAIGKRGGSKGGTNAAKNMTKKQRRARALKAVAAREAKRKGRGQ